MTKYKTSSERVVSGTAGVGSILDHLLSSKKYVTNP